MDLQMNASSARRRLVIGNWKMHGNLVDNAALLGALRHADPACELAVCVPFPYLTQTAELLKGSMVSWGVQDVSKHAQGAFTGEVSAMMLNDFGCKWGIVGHSERRAMHGETDQLVADKAAAAIASGLTPVVCVGETLTERDAGQAVNVIHRQLAPVLAMGDASLLRLVIAYEPVWAIGTGRTATPEQAQEVHAAIRAALAGKNAASVRVLYGGSVKAANAASLFGMPDIDGALVGGASLVADEFLKIAAA
jgi:triosephosphate isomerase